MQENGDMSQRTITLFIDVEGENVVESFSELLEPDAVPGGC